MDKLKKRILDISKRYHLTHIGSCLSVLPILCEIYNKKKFDDKVVLSNAHAHLAHLIVRDNWVGDGIDSSEIISDVIRDFGIHCDRKAGCDASGGSLGHGLGISIGMALVDKKKTIYCILSDGSLQEGSEWEALRILKQLKLKNVKVVANLNGYTALAKIDRDELAKRVRSFYPFVDIRYTHNGKGFEGLKGHYKIIK